MAVRQAQAAFSIDEGAAFPSLIFAITPADARLMPFLLRLLLR